MSRPHISYIPPEKETSLSKTISNTAPKRVCASVLLVQEDGVEEVKEARDHWGQRRQERDVQVSTWWLGVLCSALSKRPAESRVISQPGVQPDNSFLL